MANSFSRQDFEMNRLSYSEWESRKNESVDEYALRRRKIELCALVRKIIESEFDEDEQYLLQLRMEKKMRVKEISELLGVHKSTVYRKLKRIEAELYDKLKYAMQYRFGESFSDKAETIVKNCDALCFSQKPKTVSSRIYNLRLKQCFELQDVSDMTGIKNSRLKKIEQGAEDITAGEVSKLSLFYKVSSDYILFGNTAYS